MIAATAIVCGLAWVGVSLWLYASGHLDEITRDDRILTEYRNWKP